MRWHFSLDVLCVKEHEHWYSGISSEFIMHNTRVIDLQLHQRRDENVRRILHLWCDWRCEMYMVGLKGKSAASVNENF